MSANPYLIFPLSGSRHGITSPCTQYRIGRSFTTLKTIIARGVNSIERGAVRTTYYSNDAPPRLDSFGESVTTKQLAAAAGAKGPPSAVFAHHPSAEGAEAIPTFLSLRDHAAGASSEGAGEAI